jgi:flagellar hook-associated protein 1 FlgK
MGGISMILNNAKDALLTQQRALDVVSHNIANVNTEGYTRQIPILRSNDPAPYGGMIMGRGVNIDQIMQNSSSFIENRLQQEKTDLAAWEQKEVYMNVLEGIFNESSGRSLATQLTDFWNSWHDLTNNPAGFAERSIVCERGALLSQTFRDHASDLIQLTQRLNLSLDVGVGKVNELLVDIADLNLQIIGQEVEGNANDLRDKRNLLVSELSEYLDIQTHEQEDGNLTITTARGYLLVSHSEAYQLSFEGNQIMWDRSGPGKADITDTLTGGKIGGWLDTRDVIIPEYSAELDELAAAIIWNVNQIHTQGVGTEGFALSEGTYQAADTAAPLGTSASGLYFYDKVQNGSFELRLYDNTGAPVSTTTISVVSNTTTLTDLQTTITAIDADLTATIVDNTLQISTSGGYRFAFSNDTSNTLAALGLNSFFGGGNAMNVRVNPVLEANKALIAAGRLDATGGIATGDNTNALAMVNLQYQDVDMKLYQFERGAAIPSEKAVTESLDDYLFNFVGSIGIQAQSVGRSRGYFEVIVNELSETRDNISAVSLDEEMTDLIRYQQAYTAAAKLITTADEMFKTILETK